MALNQKVILYFRKTFAELIKSLFRILCRGKNGLIFCQHLLHEAGYQGQIGMRPYFFRTIEELQSGFHLKNVFPSKSAKISLVMQDLKELVYILNQYQMKPMHTNGQRLEPDSRLGKFYEGLEKDRFETDEEAEALLFPDGHGASNYRKLKSELRDKLIYTVALFNAKGTDFTDYQKAYYDCHKLWLVVKILTGQNANTAAMNLATRLVKQTERFEFTLLTMDIAAYLRFQYGLREGNDKKYHDSHNLFEVSKAVYEAESKAEEYYTRLMARTIGNRGVNTELVGLASNFYDEIAPLLEHHTSFRLHLYGNLIGLMQYTLVNDYASALPYCDEVISFFQKKPYEARVPLQIFYYQKLICHIQLRQFGEGAGVAQYCLGIMYEGTFNWFKYLELYLQLSFHTEQFDKGAEILCKAIDHPRFRFLPEHAKETWRIYEAYTHYLVSAGKISGMEKRRFKLAKFVNETPIFSKDKGGMNIAILTIRFMHLLLEKKLAKLLDETEAIKQYCYRHLNNKNTVRSYHFFRMLMQIPLGRFDAEKVSERVKPSLLVLTETPLQVANQIHEIELIPYEILWEIAMEKLRNQ